MTEVANSLTLLAELEKSGQITGTALTITDPDFPWEQWVALGSFLGEAKSRLSFYLGDWLLFGEELYKDRYVQAADVTGLNGETLENYASVCRRVARSRRRESLSFGVHAEVAALEPHEQIEWLGRAEANRWTRRVMREQLTEAGVRRTRQIAPPAVQTPLAANPIVEAASGLTVIRDALEKVHHGEIDTVDLPRAIRALDRSTETLKVAARIPTLVDAVVRLLEDARPDAENESFYVVGREALDELRALVATEGGTT